jgi:hypothetical protein
MNDHERYAWEMMKAWQEARDTAGVGSKHWEWCESERKKSEQEYYRAKD